MPSAPFSFFFTPPDDKLSGLRKPRKDYLLYFDGFPGFTIDLYKHRTKSHVVLRQLELVRRLMEEAFNGNLFLHADDRIVWSGHADIGDVGGAAGENRSEERRV